VPRPDTTRVWLPLLAFQPFCGKLRWVNLGWITTFFRSRYLLAIAGGLLLSAAFPSPSVAGMAWIAPALMVAAALGGTPAGTFRIGYIGALAHYLSMLYWLLLIPYRWHGLPLAPALGWLALSAFLSLFPAFWVWLTVGVSTSSEKVSMGAATPIVSEAYLATLARTWLGRTFWALSGAASWVAWEMVLARIFGGFPWGFLGASQFRLVPLIQIASFTGIYGVSFLVIWFSLSLLSAGLMVLRRPTARSVWVAELFLPVLVIAVLFSWGLRKTSREPAPARSIKALLIQPSIPQTLIWDSGKDAERFRELVQLSERAVTNEHAALMIWPESALPKMLRYDQETFDAITGLARRHRLWLIVGSDDAEPRRNPRNPDDADYFNSSFLVSPDGEVVKRYAKRNLVIFGEYIPLMQWLPLLKYFTPIQGGFTPGSAPVRFQLRDLGIQTAVLICYEDTFPQLARTDVNPETDFLVNITNDGWFGEGAAQWQQATSALFRTVENHLPLVRCSNNGLTCWIDATGRLRQVFHDNRGTIYGPGYLAVDIPVRVRGEKHSLTFYTKHGDWFGWGCVAISVCLLLRRWPRWPGRRRPKPSPGAEVP